jgi:hypothetical protein
MQQAAPVPVLVTAPMDPIVEADIIRTQHQWNSAIKYFKYVEGMLRMASAAFKDPMNAELDKNDVEYNEILTTKIAIYRAWSTTCQSQVAPSPRIFDDVRKSPKYNGVAVVVAGVRNPKSTG